MPETLGILNYFDTTYVNGPPIARKVHDASLSLQDLHAQTMFVNHGITVIETLGL